MGRFAAVTKRLVGVLIACTALALCAPAGAAVQVPAYGTDDYGGFSDILPPGTNGLVNGPDLALFLALGTRPLHNDDQLAMYGDLAYRTPGLTEGDFRKYFKDSRFGVASGTEDYRYSPRDDVTIVRDAPFGVPHVYGSGRDGAMFGAGYVAAEDRLFFIDILRHLGRAQLASFAGGAPGNRAFDQQEWGIAPYTEADLQRQIDQFDDLYGPEGARIQRDVDEYVAGVNAYIADARLNPLLMPGEYAAIGRLQGPDNWKPTDIIATAALVGGIFGKGGGNELGAVRLRAAFIKRFGPALGTRLWKQLAAYDDPEAPTTVRGKAFPYQAAASASNARAIALPDRGTLTDGTVSVTGTGTGASRSTSLATGTGRIAAGLRGLIALPSSNSNALLISRGESRSGHPLAVFGPQTGYFAPEILMEQDVHAPAGPGAPGIDARGAAFPGVNLYVELGHGRDYAWSATSAGQDIIDTFAVPLCEPGGGRATKASEGYVYKGRCEPMERLVRHNSWRPTLADMTPAGTQTLVTLRTKLGLVAGRATIKGKPYAYTRLRSTYMHEVDSAIGFSRFNDPARMRNARDFQSAASHIGYTFNWLYADDRDIAYFNSGSNPVRARGVNGQLPVFSRYAWAGFNPANLTARFTPFAQHPQTINGQPYITSWNNKQARGYSGPDTNMYSSIYRSSLLDGQIEKRIRGPKKIDLMGLVDAMEEAGLQDLRGVKVLPLALRVIGTPRDPALRDAVSALRAWVASGAQRRDKNRDGRYDHADAIRIMDAWWPKLLEAEFAPVMGKPLFDELHRYVGFDNDPNNDGDHLGSAYEHGWYGYAYKDLRTLLNRRAVRGAYARTFCGAGSRARCKTALETSLKAALAEPAKTTYPADDHCAAGNQFCRDEVSFRPLGGATQPLIHWINRPTYQQAVELKSHRPR
jgi:acyl-homoserine lactone acylase PvdQ